MSKNSDDLEIRRTFKSGETVFQEGEHGSYAFVIESGEVEISFTRDGNSKPIAKLGPGEIFGEMALIDNRVRSATAVATSDVELMIVRRAQIQRALRASDPTVRMLLEVLLGRYRRLQEGTAVDDAESVLSKEQMAFFGPARYEHESAIERLKFERELQEAITESRLRVVYQPIVSMADGTLAGFEALVRWNHQERGDISPHEFISFAEAAAMIRPIDSFVLHEAVGAMQRMHEALAKKKKISGAPNYRPPFVSVNLAGDGFSDGAIIREIREIFATTGFDPSALRVEVTEEILADNPETMNAMLLGLRDMGVHVSIDDFGTGFSNMSNLVRFPIAAVKIDRVFVASMLAEADSREVVEAIIDMAHNLKMEVMAEGIETVDQLQRLWQLGCEYGQGFMIAHPLDEEGALEFALAGPVLTKGPVLLHEKGKNKKKKAS